jgi:site-specific recombinase XerD
LRFKAFLIDQGYSRPAIKSYCGVAQDFLEHLESRAVAIQAVTPDHVEAYLRGRRRAYRRRHHCVPRNPNDWQWQWMSPIQALLRLARGQWPPPSVIDSQLDGFRIALNAAGRTRGTVWNYIYIARRFLSYLSARTISVDIAGQMDVSRFIDFELHRFRRKQGQRPRRLVQWRCGLTSGIHALLRHIQGQWPPPSPVHPGLLRLTEHLQQECPDRKTRLHYVRICCGFLAYWEARNVALENIEACHVATYCRYKLRMYRKRHHRGPCNLQRWRLGIQIPIHRLLRLMHGYWPPQSRPDPSVIAFREHLIEEGFRASVIPTRLSMIRVFLRFLGAQHVSVEEVKPAHVALYLESRLAAYQRSHRWPPADPKLWRYRLTGPIHRYLRLVRGEWPPKVPVTDELDVIRHDLGAGYGRWLTELKGFSPETLRKNGDAAQLFLRWLGERARPERLRSLTVSDVDGFLAWRNPGLRRATRRGVTHCLRSFLDYLYGSGLLEQDLAPHVAAPTLYRLEDIPSALSKDHVARLLEVTRRDRRPAGLRDYAMLLLIKTYGLRAGEVVRLRLRDIDWRRDQIHIRQSKTRADLWLPLTAEVGEALLDYLRDGRPKGRWREVFLRMCAPCGPFTRGSSLYSVLERRLQRADIQVEGKRGPHALRYARAVELLRASVPLKSIGDILGHRSAESTEIYLKLATEDLRSIALELPLGARL